MSQKNVEIVRLEYERVNADYKVEYEGERGLFDPDFEFDGRDIAPAMGIVRDTTRHGTPFRSTGTCSRTFMSS